VINLPQHNGFDIIALPLQRSGGARALGDSVIVMRFYHVKLSLAEHSAQVAIFAVTDLQFSGALLQQCQELVETTLLHI
jgi:hypothetical protein